MDDSGQVPEAVSAALEEANRSAFTRMSDMDRPPFEAFSLREPVTMPEALGNREGRALEPGLYFQDTGGTVYGTNFTVDAETFAGLTAEDAAALEEFTIHAELRPVERRYVDSSTGELIRSYNVKTGELITWKAMERAEADGDHALAEEIFSCKYRTAVQPVAEMGTLKAPVLNGIPQAPVISLEGATAHDPTGTKLAQFWAGPNQTHLYDPGGVHLTLRGQTMDVILERLEEAGGSFEATRALTESDNNVMLGVCNAIINGYPVDKEGAYGVTEGPYYVSPRKILEGMGLDTHTADAFAELESAISYLSTIQAEAIVPLKDENGRWSGETKREAGQLIEYSRTTVILPDGRISEDYYTFGQLPLIYRVAKDLNQVKTYPIAVLKSSTRGSLEAPKPRGNEQTLRRLVAQHAVSVENGNARGLNANLRIVRSAHDPKREIKLEKAGYDLTDAKVRARARKIIDDELNALEKAGRLGGHEWHKEGRTIAYVTLIPTTKRRGRK